MFGFPVTAQGRRVQDRRRPGDRRVQPGAHRQDAEGTDRTSRPASRTCSDCTRANCAGPPARRPARRPGAAPASLPVCDHYSGVEARMRKSLAAAGRDDRGVRRLRVRRHARLRRRRAGRRRGRACGAGRRAGAGRRHRRARRRCGCIRSTIRPSSRTSPPSRGKAGARLCHIMVPKVESVRRRAARRRARSTRRGAGATCRCMC